MTNNMKYRRPLPIKAQAGRTLMLMTDDRAEKAKQENARRKAKSEYYFDQAPSIPNLAKGIYYWATSEPMLFGEDETPNVSKGVAPAVGTAAISAVRSVPQAVNWVKQSLPGLAFLSSWLGGRSGQTTPAVQSVSRAVPVARPRIMDRAEEAAQDSTATAAASTTAPTDSVSTSAPQPTPENNDNKDNNKDKKGLKNLLWEGSGKPSKLGPNFGRNLRNWGVRVPLYTGAAAVGLDAAGNLYSASSEPDSIQHQWKWPATRARFSMERGLLKVLGDAYRTDKPQVITPPMAPQATQTRTVPSDTVVARPRTTAVPTTTSTQSELDSLNNLWYDQLQ